MDPSDAKEVSSYRPRFMTMKLYLQSIILNEGNRSTQSKERATISTVGCAAGMVGGKQSIPFAIVESRNVYP